MRYFFRDVPKDAQILEVGCGDGWVGTYLKKNGWVHYTGVDLCAPADIVGDIRDWKSLGIRPESYDVIVAFEVVEHVHCFKEFLDILKPGGLLMLTSPLPHMDWLCRAFEGVGLNQKRTSPHDHLIYFRNIPLFQSVELKTIAFMSQWGIFRKM